MSAERCGHCGREGALEQVDDLRLYGQTVAMHHPHAGVEEGDRQVRLVVYCCSGCVKPTLLQYTYLDGWSDPGEFAGLHRIYPEVRDLADLPQRVGARYGKLLELMYEPDAFAVRAGRLLEAVCAEQGITSGTLEKRLDKLVARGDVPQALTDQAHLVRAYRNLGGHDDDLEVGEDDVPLIRGFVEALLDFLYFGPANLERGRADLERRKAELKHREA